MLCKSSFCLQIRQNFDESGYIFPHWLEYWILRKNLLSRIWMRNFLIWMRKKHCEQAGTASGDETSGTTGMPWWQRSKRLSGIPLSAPPDLVLGVFLLFLLWTTAGGGTGGIPLTVVTMTTLARRERHRGTKGPVHSSALAIDSSRNCREAHEDGTQWSTGQLTAALAGGFQSREFLGLFHSFKKT